MKFSIVLGKPIVLLAIATTLVLSLQGCVAVIVGGAVMSTLAATDRRSLGAQAEDASIVLKGSGRIEKVVTDLGRVSVVSFNRKVLLTGEVKDEKMKQDEIDILWQKAMQESIKDGEMYTRYRFAKLVAEKALAEHAMREVQRLGQEIEPDDIASILACRDMLDAQPVPPRTWVELTEQQRNDIEDACEMIIGKPAFDLIDAALKGTNT